VAFATIIDRLNEWIGRAVCWLALAMVLIGAYNAVARYFDRHLGTALSSNTYLELQWYMFGAMFLFAAAYALRHDAHVRVDVFYAKLSPRGRAWVNLFGSLLLLLPFCALVIWVSWDSVVRSWSIREMSPDPGGLPRYPLRAAVPIAFALLMLQGISYAIRQVAVLRGVAAPESTKDPADEEVRP
jgi:TRAP-type mannitol/chloroaromatic compound transport system permease small subunit